MKQQRMSRRIWQVILVAAFFLGIGLIADDTVSLASAPNGVRDGVAVIAEYGRLKGTDTYRRLSWGSSFFVGNPGENPEYLVTNYHVIADYEVNGGGENVSVWDTNGNEYDKLVLRVYFDSKTYVEAYTKETNPKMDVAVLYLENPTDRRKALALREPSQDDVGTSVYAYGFPGIADNELTDSVSEWSSSDISVTSGIVSRLTTQSGTGVRQVQTDTEFWSGNSGGPLVTEDGVVIGMTSSGIKTWTVRRDGLVDTEEVKYAVSMAEVIPLLTRNSIPYVSSATGGNAEGGPDQPGDVAQVPVEEGSDNTMLIIIIASVAVVVIVLVIVLIVVLSKKKKPAAPPVPPQPMPMPQRPQPQIERGVTVQALSGILNGRSFTPGPDGRITFGRQPSCQVVFGSNDKNVSGNHCAVYRQDGQIVLMDTRSTNGTFMENGTRLQPNVAYPMNPGDRFYLVNTDHMFMVK